MRLRAMFDATIGRRLLVRIWVHGVVLFIGVLALTFAARWIMVDIDELHTMSAHPYIAAAVADRVLAHADDRTALARELAEVATTPIEISVFAADGAPI